MNFFNEYKKTSSTKAALQTCTPCCPFDVRHLPHPLINDITTSSRSVNIPGMASNSDACCLSKLQVDCRIRYPKKKKRPRKMQNKRYASLLSSPSTQRSISSSSQLSPYPKRRRFDSNSNTNSHYVHHYDLDSQTSSSSLSISTNASDRTERSSNFQDSRHPDRSANAEQYREGSQMQSGVNENIRDLRNSIDNLTQMIVHQRKSPPSTSLLDKLRHLFAFFRSSSKPPESLINEECCEILERHHLTKENLLSVYHLFDKNDTTFLNWLRTFSPNYILPLLLNYVKHLDSISTDKE